MAENNNAHNVDLEDVVSFLKDTAPFSDLDSATLQKLAKRCSLDFFPKGTVVLRHEISDMTHLYLIQKGAVKVYLPDSDEMASLIDFRGERGHFGALGIIRGSKASFNVETLEDTFCYKLEKGAFQELIRTDPKIAQYYLKKLSEDVVGTVYLELRSQKFRARGEDAFYLFTSEIADVIRRPPEIVSQSATVQHAANLMAELGIGSVLVTDESGEVAGILTDKDLRTKVVAEGRDYSTSVGELMSSPVKVIESHAVCFDALLQMMNEHVHHLAVKRGKDIVGVVTAHDIMIQQGTSPISLFREIVTQRQIENLYPLSSKIPPIVTTLIAGGAKANNITRVISLLNDHIVQRVLTLLQQDMGPSPHPFCWLMLGSEGRKEQTFKTDQDNALIYETPPDNWEQIKAAKLYFRRFGNAAADHLDKCGFPLCKGKMMASNPNWRKPYSVWHGYFDRWMNSPEPQGVLHATIFFDFRPAFGHMPLGERLRDFLVSEAPRRGLFLMHLAKDCLTSRPPLSFFRSFVVEKDGEHKNRLDLKTRGVVPFVDFARIMALRRGIRETNTLSRLQALDGAKAIPKELLQDSREAYEFQMQLRLVHQLRMMQEGLEPDNYIDPSELSDLEKQTLKEAFTIISRIQSHIKEEFKANEV